MTKQKLTVDPEFAGLHRKLTPEERNILETEIVNLGRLTDPICVWKGHANTILDGHNRNEIVGAFPAVTWTIEEIDLPTREDAIEWIIRRQMGRRNLTDEEKGFLRGKEYGNEKKRAGAQKGSHNNPDGRRGSGTNVCADNTLVSPESTSEKLGKKHGVHEGTIRSDEKFAKACDRVAAVIGDDAKTLILSGRSGYTKNNVTKLATKTDDEMKKDWADTQALLGDGKRKKNPRDLKLSEKIKHAVADIKRGDKKPDVFIRYGLNQSEYMRGSGLLASGGSDLFTAVDKGTMALIAAYDLRKAPADKQNAAIAEAEDKARAKTATGKAFGRQSKPATVISSLHSVFLSITGAAISQCDNWTSWTWVAGATDKQKENLAHESEIVRNAVTRFLDELDAALVK